MKIEQHKRKFKIQNLKSRMLVCRYCHNHFQNMADYEIHLQQVHVAAAGSKLELKNLKIYYPEHTQE